MSQKKKKKTLFKLYKKAAFKIIPSLSLFSFLFIFSFFFFMSGNNIKVVCRFRPQNSLEIREGGVPIISIDDEGTNVTVKVKE